MWGIKRPTAHRCRLFKPPSAGRIFGSSGIARFVQGGVVKTFRCADESTVTDSASDNFTQYIAHLRKRGGMYIQPFDYDNLISHVTGYDMAARDLGFSPPLDGMRELVQLRFGRECALTWSAMIAREFTPDNGNPMDTFFNFYDDLVAIRAEHGPAFLDDEFQRMLQFKRKRATNPRWPAQP